ncbi:MAG: hypothetical protein H6715_02705 [Myxococcales bacterium]|nr:hypothetical protein [Myxococcales bacterium]MCB9708157.1 hypothetical protein [Myxococcales bacterium]
MNVARWWRKIARALVNDLALKGLAIVVAISLFAIVRGAQDAQRTYYVELTPMLPSDQSSQVLVSNIPQDVRVTLQGSQSVLTGLQRDGIPAVNVDLRNTRGRYFYFDPASFDLPPGVRVVQIFPASLRLSYAKRSEKRVRVDPRVVGQSREGLSLLTPLRITPSHVRIRGPAQRVNAIDVVNTEPVDIASMPAGAHQLDVPLESLPEFVSYADAATVSIQIEIVPEIRYRTLKRLTVAVVGARAKVRPSKVSVVLKGQPATMNAVVPEEIVPYVDLGSISMARGSSQSLEVNLQGVPDGAKVHSIEPPKVIVTLMR